MDFGCVITVYWLPWLIPLAAIVTTVIVGARLEVHRLAVGLVCAAELWQPAAMLILAGAIVAGIARLVDAAGLPRRRAIYRHTSDTPAGLSRRPEAERNEEQRRRFYEQHRRMVGDPPLPFTEDQRRFWELCRQWKEAHPAASPDRRRGRSARRRVTEAPALPIEQPTIGVSPMTSPEPAESGPVDFAALEAEIDSPFGTLADLLAVEEFGVTWTEADRRAAWQRILRDHGEAASD